MKNLLLIVLLVGVLFPAGAAPQADGLANRVDRADLQTLKDRVEQDMTALNQAADARNLKEVVLLGKRVVEEAKALEKHVRPGDKVALVDGEPNPGYVVWEAQPAEEFVLLAQILQGKARLARTVDQHPDLLNHHGFLGWVTGNVPQMHVNYISMAEHFVNWKNCEAEILFAQEQG